MWIHASLKNLGMIELLDLDELKWSQVYDMLDASVTTHGQHGNMIKALTIKRQEFTDRSRRNDEKKGLLSGWMQKKEPEQDNEPVIRY